jgi:ADP-ribosylglycohydrolase
MSADSNITAREQILGGLWGSLVGDALGVPVEFKERAAVQREHVTEMRGYGSHRQPPGTWSDDSSLLLCTVESLLEYRFDLEDMGRRFVRWSNAEIWTPHGKVFDIGIATSQALSRISQGVRAEYAGGDTEHSNGNGSLMRILPVSLRFARARLKDALDRVHSASAITHRHARSQLACGFLTLYVRELIDARDPVEGLQNCVNQFRAFYEQDPWWSAELGAFESISDGRLNRRPESEIRSGGYVMDTLTASIWCLLTTSSFESCVLKAVNLGGDTDTTGCVAGGLAGVHYGVAAIQPKWIKSLAREAEIRRLFEEFTELCFE